MERLISLLGPLVRHLLWLLLRLPRFLLERLTPSLPPGGEVLAPDQRFLAALSTAVGADSVEGIPVEVQREQTDDSAALVSDPVRAAGMTVTEHEVAGASGPLRMRLYRPDGDGDAPGPLLVWFHGGGWVVGSIDSHDASLRMLSALSGVRVATVEYRLAPEHPWPAAPDDCLAAWRDIRARATEFGTEPDRVLVGGDSAGGNLAVVLCLELSRTDEPMPLGAVLLYPVTDLAGKSDSYHQFANGFFLSEEKMDFYRDAYLPEGVDRADPRVSPLRAKLLRGLPPTYLATAVADPLRDEGEALAERMRGEGVEVATDRFPAIHGWFNMTVGPTSVQAMEALAARVSRLASVGSPAA
jgi:acetyl esterase